MSNLLERPLTIGCSLTAMFLMLAAWGRWSEHLGRPLEPTTAPGVSLSGARDDAPRRVFSHFRRDSDSPSFPLDFLNEDDCEEESEFWLIVGQTRDMAQPQPRALGLSDADHTTLARGRWTRISILRC
jgi:hypothetical protein